MTEEPKQGEVKHVANSTGEVKEAEAAPQSASEIEQVDSLQVGAFCVIEPFSFITVTSCIAHSFLR